MHQLQLRAEATEDPRGFLRRFDGAPGVILDEVQRVPDLFSYLQGVIDEHRGGPFLLTGSQNFLMAERISQSLAGRAAVLELLPFSVAELLQRSPRPPDALAELPTCAPPEVELEHLLHAGLFPPIHDRGLEPSVWLDGYVRTYVERDVRTLLEVGNLATFARFVRLCAGRSGQLLNAAGLAADAGVSHVTARRWISVLQASYVLDLVLPFHANLTKRLVKSPKLYFLDSGLLCHLLGLRRAEDVWQHPLRGAIFETFVYTELRKVFTHHGERPAVLFYRDRSGHEVDFVVDLGVRRIAFEVKAGETVPSDAFVGLERLRALLGEVTTVLVHGGTESYRRREHVVFGWHALS